MSKFVWTIIIFLLLTSLSVVQTSSANSEPLPNDAESAAMLFGIIESPLPSDLTPPPDWEAGMMKQFKVLNIAAGSIENCTAKIFLVTDNIVFWCDEVDFDMIPPALLQDLQKFDTETLSILRKTFGKELSPGVDHDPRFHVLFTAKISSGYNGYFSAQNSADPRLYPTSNGMELIFLNTNLFPQGNNAVLDTLAHEYQHMVHHAYDANEMSFINEGFSGLAEYIALGKIRDTFIRQYLNDTGRSLIWWPESGGTQAYYGSSFLFSLYLYEYLGEDFIRTAVNSPQNGLNGIDQALKTIGSNLSADELFSYWTAALLGQLIQSPAEELDYPSYIFPQNGIYRDISSLDCGSTENHEVSQYGLRFYQVCSSPSRITVSGNSESPATNLQIPGGSKAWWSGAVNNSIALLSHDFDLRPVNGQIQLEYDANYVIEKDYDYYYLLLEDEAGHIYHLIPSCATDDNPAGQNMGSGSTGNSNGVRHEIIDLDPWAGQNIRLTFVYVTDTAGIADGVLLDNFRIDAIGFYDDAETSDNSWKSNGFGRIEKSVPQRFLLVVLHPQTNGNPNAEIRFFDGGTPQNIVCPEGGCSFAVSAVNREIRSRAAFTIQTESLVIP